jgi:hypothetical protein
MRAPELRPLRARRAIAVWAPRFTAGTYDAWGTPMASREPQNPRVVLVEHHQRIERLLERLLASVRADERESSATLLAKTEKAILAHLDVEEMFVLPALAHTHAAEVTRLRSEHATIRRELGEIGLALELHALRAETLDAFKSALEEHAEREESLAYAEAERKLTVNIARAIFERIKEASSSRRERRTKPASPRTT